MQNVAKGLALAALAATANSAMELSGKKALSGRGFLEGSLFIRLVVACAFTLATACVFLLRPGYEATLDAKPYPFVRLGQPSAL